MFLSLIVFYCSTEEVWNICINFLTLIYKADDIFTLWVSLKHWWFKFREKWTKIYFKFYIISRFSFKFCLTDSLEIQTDDFYELHFLYNMVKFEFFKYEIIFLFSNDHFESYFLKSNISKNPNLLNFNNIYASGNLGFLCWYL